MFAKESFPYIPLTGIGCIRRTVSESLVLQQLTKNKIEPPTLRSIVLSATRCAAEIQCNLGYAAKFHVDKNNIGPSYVLAYLSGAQIAKIAHVVVKFVYFFGGFPFGDFVFLSWCSCVIS